MDCNWRIKLYVWNYFLRLDKVTIQSFYMAFICTSWQYIALFWDIIVFGVKHEYQIAHG